MYRDRPTGLFPSGYPTKTLYAFIMSCLCYMSYLSYSRWFYHINDISRRVQIMNLKYCAFSPPWVLVFHSVPLSDTLNLCLIIYVSYYMLRVTEKLNETSKFYFCILLIWTLIKKVQMTHLRYANSDSTSTATLNRHAYVSLVCERCPMDVQFKAFPGVPQFTSVELC